MARSLLDRLRTLEQTHKVDKRDCSVNLGLGHGQGSDCAPDLSSLGFEQQMHNGQTYWLRELRYDLLTWHGRACYAELIEHRFPCMSQMANCEISWKTLRFYDTETTGLGTGAGTFAFLHAVGQIEGDEFCIYQYIVQDYMDEPLILDVLCQHHFAAAVLVSFNGKSFDWPLLQNRCILHGIPIPSLLAHVDLLHPSRRLWKQQLDRVSLGEVEKHQLGLRRIADLPGHEAPGRYFAFLADGQVERLAPVLDHNAMDVCTLTTLLLHVEAVISLKENLPIASASELAAIGRWYADWGEDDTAQRCYVRASDAIDANWQTHWNHSLFLKRRKCFAEASEVWKMMLEQYGWNPYPAIELAKLAEHRMKDWIAAENYVRTALACISQPRTEDMCGVRIPYRVGEATTRQDYPSMMEDERVANIRLQLHRRLQRILAKRLRHQVFDKTV